MKPIFEQAAGSIPKASRLRVLITGAAGRIGTCLLENWGDQYDLRSFDRVLVEGIESFKGDLTDARALRRAMEGVDVVVHLAGTKREAPFVSNLVPNNVIGLYNLFESAREASVRRVVFASSAQIVAAYPPEACLVASDVPRPSSLYSATKVLGETLGRYHFDCYGIEFVSVRIGWFLPPDDPVLRRDGYARHIWLSPRDCAQLFGCAVEAPLNRDFDGYAVIFGTSKIEPARLCLAEARALGFEPQDDVRDIPICAPIKALIPSVQTTNY